MNFINDMLKVDFEGTMKRICEYGEKNESLCNVAPAIDSLFKYKNGEISFSKVNYFINKIIQDCEMKKVGDSNNNAITNKNVAISKINDEMFIMGQILEVVNIDNFLVTVVDNKDNSYMLDFEDNHFLFMFNVSDNEIQIMKNEILKNGEVIR